MKVWIIKAGEPLPTDDENVRLFRAGIFSNFLADNGHEVIWWSANFDHQNKRHRGLKQNSIRIKKNLELFPLHSRGYKKNISIERLRDHSEIANEFSIEVKHLPKPDIILCSYPTIDFSKVVNGYCKKNNIPYVLDIRDLWPDIYVNHLFPSRFQAIGRFLLKPWLVSVKKVMKEAAGLIAISQPILNWGLRYAERAQNTKDAVFPFGYNFEALEEGKIIQAQNYFKDLGIEDIDYTHRVCLFATMNNSFNLQTVFDALTLFEAEGGRIQLIICGDGESLASYKGMSSQLQNVFFTGWVGFDKIRYLMSISDIGLAPYNDTPDFAMSIPNKAIEYFSGGLPILTSINGYLSELLSENNCGWSYVNNKPDELFDLLRLITKDIDALNMMKENSKKMYERYFKAEVVYKNYMNHLIRLTKD